MPSTSTNIFGTNSARRAASSRFHGVVRVSRTTSEIEVATRITMIAAAVQALARDPELVAEPRAERDRRSCPRVMTLSVAGSTTMPVKIGMNSHTRLTKKRERQPARRGQRRG